MVKNNKIIAVVGPSGSGKTKMGQEVLRDILGFTQLITDTTRAMREGEVQDISYYFKSVEEFKASEHIEFTEYPKNSNTFYGLSKEEVVKKSETGNCYAVMDINGALALRKRFPDTKIIFIYSPIEILEKRMRDRGDKEESIQKRLKNIEDSKEFENYKYADLVVENIDFEKVKNQIISYILTI